MQYLIETRIVQLTGETEVRESSTGFGQDAKKTTVERADVKLISRAVGNLIAEHNLTVGQIKTALRAKVKAYKDSEIDSQKLEADEVFTNDAQEIAPQPWLLYTITLKK